MTSIHASVGAPPSSTQLRPVLPSRGVAVVKSCLSGDTVVLQGKPTVPGGKSQAVVFTLERITAPRVAAKSNSNVDEPGAFPSREFLRALVVGKQVTFETRKQGASAGDRVYGLLFIPNPIGDGTVMNIAVESVRNGHAVPKITLDDNTDTTKVDEDPVLDYEKTLHAAFLEAKSKNLGIHSPNALVRTIKSAGDDFQVLELVEKSSKLCDGGAVTCVIEHVFDGSKLRVLVTDASMAKAGLQYAYFTLIIGGITSPRMANPRSDPPVESEPHADESREFVESRLLQRELKVMLYGLDKPGLCAVGTPLHPRGNIGVELLKNGLARMCDWSSRLMNPLDLPAMRVAENSAKRANLGVWKSYVTPTLTGASELNGIVVEVLTGDTLSILLQGERYDSETKLRKVSLASVRAPRVGNEKLGKPDEPYARECKNRLKVLLAGKSVKVSIHYERDIPMGTTSERRQFGTISTAKREDIGEVLVAEGLAVTQRHRGDEEKSPRYDMLVSAETAAKLAKKGVHSEAEYKKHSITDLTDPKKAKSYFGSLIRAGNVKATVELVLNGSRFKLFIPSENCEIIFALENIRCPQPAFAANPVTKALAKPAEPFGEEAKRHARLSILQRTVEITCTGVSLTGVITGHLYIGSGQQRSDFGLELICAGLATVDQRKIEQGFAPKSLLDAQNQAAANRVGLWSIESNRENESLSRPTSKVTERVLNINITEIRNSSNFFFRVSDDDSGNVIDKSMKQFSSNYGIKGAPCDAKVNKIVAALFDDGTGNSWYRAKILEIKSGVATVLFIDWGNSAKVDVSTQLRPLDFELGVDRIPPAAKEAIMALTKARDLDDDDGVAAARYLRSLCWGKIVKAQIFCEQEAKAVIALYEPNNNATSINEELISDGLARISKAGELKILSNKIIDTKNLESLFNSLSLAQENARKSRRGIWRYGDIGDDDDDAI